MTVQPATGSRRRINANRKTAGPPGPRRTDPGPSRGGAPWIPAETAGILLVTESAELQGEVARVGAAAAVELTIAESMEQASGRWAQAAAVLLGSDIGGQCRNRNGPTIMVGLRDDSQLWERASRAGVDRVAVLPQAAEWLAEFLGRMRDPTEVGSVLGVVGGCGGAGASTLAVMLSVRAAAEGLSTLLIDADEWGGGLDIALAAEDVSGLRWPDLLNATGTINPDQLAAALPAVAGCSLLSWGPHPADPRTAMRLEETGAEVVRAARRGYQLTVVDLGRSPQAINALGSHCDQFLVVTPAQLRSAVASARLLAELPPVPTRLIVRGRMREGLDAELISASVGAPVAGTMPQLRGLGQSAENGRLAEAARSRAVRKLAAGLIAGFGAESGRGPATGLNSGKAGAVAGSSAVVAKAAGAPSSSASRGSELM